MTLESSRDLFVHELGDVLSAEQIFLKLLPELAREARHPELKQALTEHEAETKTQIERLQGVHELLGVKPERTVCHAAEGLAREHAAIHEEQPAPAVLELANIGAGARTEHYEIAAYTGLVQLARDLHQREAAKLLRETLAEEKAMAKRLEALAKTLGKQAET